MDGHVAQTIAAKPKLVQISYAYGPPPNEGSAVLPRSKYIEIKKPDPKAKKQKDWPEYQTCKSMTEAIVTEGKADMVALARAFLDNPHWGWHAAQALSADVARPVQYQRSAPKLWPGAALRG